MNARPARAKRNGSGAVANERLTALTGAVLLVLFAAEIVTVALLRELMLWHFVVGVLLAGPVAVKTASTGWRFVRYYARDAAYRRKGPPRLLMRVLSPVLMASTFAVIGSGIALAVTGPAPDILLRIHVVSFLVWLVLVIAHVVVYGARAVRAVGEDWLSREAAPPSDRAGRGARLAVTAGGLACGIVPAALIAPAAGAWDGWFGQPVTGFGILAVIAVAAAGLAVAVRRRRR
ncbi:hypothetical protein SPF06_04530 [Sinomonas sp. JGH33]|uniref:DUF4405 domain-containing protein n=1 Tax=Sinomonas terricola TaxID=3110330 RepID=A0ABU5T2X0_9MICC|nr:hypothetical protein [Sinomonas sp. JGH33]MEA5453983.1 hypothetical protein [Sinomonas sp. JGH33]